MIINLQIARVGPYIRISGIRQEKSQISGNIWQGMPDNPAAYPALFGKKKQIRPNPIVITTLSAIARNQSQLKYLFSPTLSQPFFPRVAKPSLILRENMQ